MDYRDAIQALANGNVSGFRKWLKRAKKIDILDAIEYAQGQGFFKRHQIINYMRDVLEDM